MGGGEFEMKESEVVLGAWVCSFILVQSSKMLEEIQKRSDRGWGMRRLMFCFLLRMLHSVKPDPRSS